MTESEAKVLIVKYNQGLASPAEAALLKYWFIVYANRPGSAELDYQLMSAELRSRIELEPLKKARLRLWPRIAAAAAIVLVVGAGLFYFGGGMDMFHENQGIVLKNDIGPGGHKAYLILADGSRISLTDADTGTLSKQGGVSVTKTDSGEIRYAVRKEASVSFKSNTITTPKGGTWQVVLPDGSKVWLNAASSLTFPTSFDNRKERRVTLSGEAYFEVAKDKTHPFIVSTDRQDVQVLGTHFNINNYEEESMVNTTLLEGSVKVSGHQLSAGSVILSPNQQASLGRDSRIMKTSVDAENAVDWKNGRFRFKKEPLASILRKISRWYDVEIVYRTDQAKLPTFSGSVSRYGKVSAVLEMLQETSKAHFEVSGRTIIVKYEIVPAGPNHSEQYK